MYLLLIFLLLASIGGVALLLLIPLQITVSGSLNHERWYLMVSILQIKIMLVPGKRLNLCIFDRMVKSFVIPSFYKDGPEKNEKSKFNIQSLLNFPLSIELLELKGNIGFKDCAVTGKIYGWISALSAALSGTRLHLSVTPDFTGSNISLKVNVRVRIRSLFHVILFFTRMVSN